MRTKRDLHTVCGNLTDSNAMRVQDSHELFADLVFTAQLKDKMNHTCGCYMHACNIERLPVSLFRQAINHTA